MTHSKQQNLGAVAAIKNAFPSYEVSTSPCLPIAKYWVAFAQSNSFVDLEVSMHLVANHAEDLQGRWERWMMASKNPIQWFFGEMAQEDWRKLQVMVDIKQLLSQQLLAQMKSGGIPSDVEQWDYELLENARAVMLDGLSQFRLCQRAMANSLLFAFPT